MWLTVNADTCTPLQSAVGELSAIVNLSTTICFRFCKRTFFLFFILVLVLVRLLNIFSLSLKVLRVNRIQGFTMKSQ